MRRLAKLICRPKSLPRNFHFERTEYNEQPAERRRITKLLNIRGYTKITRTSRGGH